MSEECVDVRKGFLSLFLALVWKSGLDCPGELVAGTTVATLSQRASSSFETLKAAGSRLAPSVPVLLGCDRYTASRHAVLKTEGYGFHFPSLLVLLLPPHNCDEAALYWVPPPCLHLLFLILLPPLL